MVGFIFGLIVFNVDDSFSRGEGLTNEMLSRCEIHSLVVGIFIAIPSGAAVAISILGENIGSLVGVAISASLLPPAVNSGVLWALATMFMFHQQDDTKYNVVIHTKFWSEHQAVELFVLGSLSMALTISNVICVYAAGTLFLKVCFPIYYSFSFNIFNLFLSIDKRSGAHRLARSTTILET